MQHGEAEHETVNLHQECFSAAEGKNAPNFVKTILRNKAVRVASCFYHLGFCRALRWIVSNVAGLSRPNLGRQGRQKPLNSVAITPCTNLVVARAKPEHTFPQLDVQLANLKILTSISFSHLR